jgi:hypothetical protein
MYHYSSKCGYSPGSRMTCKCGPTCHTTAMQGRSYVLIRGVSHSLEGQWSLPRFLWSSLPTLPAHRPLLRCLSVHNSHINHREHPIIEKTVYHRAFLSAGLADIHTFTLISTEFKHTAATSAPSPYSKSKNCGLSPCRYKTKKSHRTKPNGPK